MLGCGFVFFCGNLFGLLLLWTSEGNLEISGSAEGAEKDQNSSLGFGLYQTSTISLQQKETFKVRWFSLDSQERNLLYFKNPLVSELFFAIPQAPSQRWVGRRGLLSDSSSGCIRQWAQSQELISLIGWYLWSWAVWELCPLQWLWGRS